MSAPSPSQSDRPSYGLWSLWDIMKPFQLAHFLSSQLIGGMAFHQRAARPPVIQNHFLRKYLFDDVPNDSYIDPMKTFFEALEKSCIQMELTTSLTTVRRIRGIFASPNPSHSALSSLYVELQGRLFDEMAGKIYWSLNTRESALYAEPRKGWEEIIVRFPDSVIDIEEAAKCFALSRYAAAVFHSTQVVEFGLIELGKLIGVTDPSSGWTATANRLQNIIKKGHDARTPFERQHFAFLEQMHGTIEGLKNAWRNKISHAHGKLTLLTADFSPDIAEEILFATRAFMRRLATDAPSSEPKA